MPAATMDDFDLDIRLQSLDAPGEKYPPPTIELNCTTTSRRCTSDFC